MNLLRRRALGAAAVLAAAGSFCGRAVAQIGLPGFGVLVAPPAGRWHFGLYYGGYEHGMKVAVVEYAIELSDGSYRITATGRAEGLAALVYSGVLSQRSEGELTPAGFRPRHYWERRGKRPERSVDIDYRKREVRFSDRPPVALVDGMQDRLSVLMQLGLMARTRPERFASGREVEVAELASSRVEPTRYASRGEVSLKTRAKVLRALHLERVAPQDPDDSRIDIWLGYDRDLLPVRLRFADPRGQVLDQLLED